MFSQIFSLTEKGVTSGNNIQDIPSADVTPSDVITPSKQFVFSLPHHTHTHVLTLAPVQARAPESFRPRSLRVLLMKQSLWTPVFRSFDEPII